MPQCQWVALTINETGSKEVKYFRYDSFSSESAAKEALQMELNKIGSIVLECSTNPYKYKNII